MFHALLPLAFVFALPSTGETSRFQLDVNLALTPAADKWDDERISNRSALDGNGKLGFTVFARRVTDDDAPPALQPFLQRVARFTVSGSGYGGYQYESGDQRFDYSGFTLAAHADGYIGRYVYLGASFGYDREQAAQADAGGCPDGGCTAYVEHLPFQVAAGVRLADTRLWATWGATAYRSEDEAWQVRYWAHVGLRVYSVIHRHIEIGGGAQLLRSGFGLDFATTFWLGRRLGLGFGAFYRIGAPVDTPFGNVTGWTVGGDVSAKWWLTRRWALALDVSPRYGRVAEFTDPDPTRTSCIITLGLSLRL
jgi:hypothetical protein